MTWAELYAELKSSLGTDTQWGESELMMYSNQAIRIYSRYFPQDDSSSLATDGSTQAWTLPSDIVRATKKGVKRLEFDEAGGGDPRFLEEIQIKPGTQFYDVSSQYPLMWHVEEGQLKLTSAPDADDVLTLYYFKKHTEMADSTTVVSVPDADLELIHLYVASRATARLAISTGRRDRFKMRQIDAGNPEQNPLTPLHKVMVKEFWDALYQRLPTGNVDFHRRGRG